MRGTATFVDRGRRTTHCYNLYFAIEMLKTRNGPAVIDAKARYCLFVSRDYTNVTDRRTLHHGIGHAYTQLRAVKINKTRRALGRAHLPPTKVFPRLVGNKTTLKPRFAAATGAQYLYVGFSRRNKILRCSAYDIGESYPVPASRL